eukprot:gnl/Spiro4/25195_TR12538_c0_g1_i1.p1 gnl/Spiro4/25195_TR12538_c0_g1~~gnl/Spiro4/25195_TR12538_c0_g1_i1.p1  ORF type:complete len:135 (-),score=31.73 gnl/Spiro4/25195_TR12538_c0_g1_i1:60-464(-)
MLVNRAERKTNLEETYNKRLDDDLEMLVDNLGGVFKAAHARVHDSAHNARESLQMMVHGTNIVHACESLLLLTQELKQHALASNISQVDCEAQQYTLQYQRERSEVMGELRRFRLEVSAAIEELQTHYNSSPFK